MIIIMLKSKATIIAVLWILNPYYNNTCKGIASKFEKKTLNGCGYLCTTVFIQHPNKQVTES